MNRIIQDDNILVHYDTFNKSDSTTNIMAKLSALIVKDAFGQLQFFVTELEEL
jgi:hypothetical protein